MEQKRKNYALYGLILALLLALPTHAQTVVTPVAGVATVDIGTCGQGGVNPNSDAVVQLTPQLTSNNASANTLLFNADQIHPTELVHVDIRIFIVKASSP